MVIDGGRCSKMLLLLLPKGPRRLPYVLIITVPLVLVSILLFFVMSFSLGAIERDLIVLGSPKMHLYTPPGIRNHQVDVLAVVGAGVIAPGPRLHLCVAVFESVPSLKSTEDPCRVFAPG